MLIVFHPVLVFLIFFSIFLSGISLCKLRKRGRIRYNLVLLGLIIATPSVLFYREPVTLMWLISIGIFLMLIQPLIPNLFDLHPSNLVKEFPSVFNLKKIVLIFSFVILFSIFFYTKADSELHVAVRFAIAILAILYLPKFSTRIKLFPRMLKPENGYLNQLKEIKDNNVPIFYKELNNNYVKLKLVDNNKNFPFIYCINKTSLKWMAKRFYYGSKTDTESVYTWWKILESNFDNITTFENITESYPVKNYIYKLEYKRNLGTINAYAYQIMYIKENPPYIICKKNINHLDDNKEEYFRVLADKETLLDIYCTIDGGLKSETYKDLGEYLTQWDGCQINYFEGNPPNLGKGDDGSSGITLDI